MLLAYTGTVAADDRQECLSYQKQNPLPAFHAGSGFSKRIMRVLLLSHCVPFADYRHHRQSGAAPIPVAVSEVCGSLMNARIHNSCPSLPFDGVSLYMTGE